MSELNNKKIKEEYKSAKLDIFLYNKGRWPAFYFLRHILCFLRQHPELCEQTDYKELYNETLVLLILRAHAESDWTRNEPKDQQGYIELLADLENKNVDSNFEYFSIEIIDDYLAYRKMMWAKGEKYTKERYDFIL